MKIIILGAGQVGGTLAEHLASEANDITVVDTDGDRLRDLGDRLDIRTVQGKASFPTVLRQAGADDADMLVAVTNSDETNMVACQVAYTLFNTPTKIARVREPAYLTRTGLFDNEAIPVDVLISPEQVVTNYIKRLIEHPGALQVIDFAEGKAQLVGIKAYYGGPLVGQELRQLREHMPNVDTRVAAIYRRNRPIIPQGDTVIEADDEVFFIAAKAHIRAVMGEMRRLDDSYKRIIIAGGGNVGERLAEAIESRYQVKIIERSPLRCRHLSDTLDSTIVLNGSASDRDLLLEENIGETDVFLALTNDDEANIMSSLLAKRLGASKVMTLINNPACLCRPGARRRDRHRHQPATGDHRHPAGPRSPRRHRERTLAAPRRSRSDRSGSPWRRQVEQGDRSLDQRDQAAAGHHHRRAGARRGSADRPWRHPHRERRPRAAVPGRQEIHPRRRATVPGRPDVLLRHALSRTAIGLRPTNTKGPRASFATAESLCSVQSLAGAGHNGRHRWKRAG